MPQPPKPPGQRSRVPRGSAMTVMAGGSPGVALALPEAPKAWLAATKASWAAFASSPLARYVIEADFDTLMRLFEMRDLQARCRREGAKRPLVEGSQGQPVTNPLLDEADRLESLIQKLEAVFGRGPLARLKLGIALGDAARSLDDLNDALSAPDDAEEPPDPRLLIVGSS